MHKFQVEIVKHDLFERLSSQLEANGLPKPTSVDLVDEKTKQKDADSGNATVIGSLVCMNLMCMYVCMDIVHDMQAVDDKTEELCIYIYIYIYIYTYFKILKMQRLYAL